MITVLCSDPGHRVWPRLERWCERRGATLARSVAELAGGELLLLVSCTEIVPAAVRGRFGKALVIHESDLPEGRGWSPLAWQILEGRREFTVSLIECADPVDSGAIWTKRRFALEGHELADEIAEARDRVRLELLDWAVEHLADARPEPQSGEPTRYPRRTPADSELDPHKTIAEQFELLRIAEPRFPAFFRYRGHRYVVTLKKG